MKRPTILQSTAGSAFFLLASTLTGAQSISTPSFWNRNGPDISNTNPGDVGIGKLPTEKLDILGNLKLDGGLREWTFGPSDRLQISNNLVGDIMSLSSGGFMGLGTSSPAYRLSVQGGTIANISGNSRICSYLGSSGFAGVVGTLDGSDNLKTNTLLTYVSGAPQHGYITVLDTSGFSAAAGMYLDPSTGLGNLFASGTKNFRVTDPANPQQEIWYASLEGPEAAAYCRGTSRLVAGRGMIVLPDHFRSIATEQGLTVHVTPLSAESFGLSVTTKSLEGIVVRELMNGRGSYEFDYEVKGVRRGFEGYRVVRPRDEIQFEVGTAPGLEPR